MKKLLLLAIVVLGISAVSFGQGGNVLVANADASANLLKVLTIDLTSGSLSFGSMTVPTGAATVTLTPDKDRSVSSGAANISLLGLTAYDVPVYTVNGDFDADFSITLPTGDVNLGNGTSTIKVNNFVSSAGLHSTLSATGVKVFTVGADLVMDENATSGLYTGNFDVTVAYE